MRTIQRLTCRHGHLMDLVRLEGNTPYAWWICRGGDHEIVVEPRITSTMPRVRVVD